MPMIFNLYVPGEYTFESHFLPRIQETHLECFEVDRNRHGIQRKGNNHLVVFMDFCLKGPPSKFTEPDGDGAQEFLFEKPHEIEFFNRVFAGQKEVAVFSLAYKARMSVILWKLLVHIADDERMMVEDDQGNLMTGPQCVQELKHLMGQA